MKSIVALMLAVLLAGCSIHPVPDNVSPVPTQEIVKSARCETKLAVYQRIERELASRSIKGIDPEAILMPANIVAIRKIDPLLALKFEAYGASAIAYTFEFLITEQDNAEASAGFKLPLAKSTFDLGIGGKLQKSRHGHRRFESLETFADLSKLDCRGFDLRDKNILYPVTGSIGLDKAMHTFIELAELGGGRGTFTDTLVFTTKVAGEISPKLVLSPVPGKFRLVGMEAKLDAERLDVHKVTVSFAFPSVDLRTPRDDSFGTSMKIAAISPAVLRSLSDDALRRASENLCVARALDREDTFGTLRLNPPEHYCRGGRVSP